MKTLDEHIRQSGIYKAHRGKKAQYEKLYAQFEALEKETGFGAKRKVQKALDAAKDFRETYCSEISAFEEAERYLKKVMQGHFDPKKLPPVKTWQSEQAKLIADRGKLNQQYIAIKSEISEAEQICKSVYSIMRQEQRQPHRALEIGR